MCGIAGWIDWDLEPEQHRPVLAAMCDRLACRGPDAEGAWFGAHAALVHRRLSVIDPAGGAQPMVRTRAGVRSDVVAVAAGAGMVARSPAGADEAPVVLTYNGELYNTAELRADLRARGHVFTSHSDTEVLLAAYLAWGAEFLERLNGIFAFGIWDVQAQRLLLARDRLGVKPLFYAARGAGLLFASELKALLVHPAVPPEVGPEGLAEVLALGPGRTPGHGVFRGVDELRPGQALLFDRCGLRRSIYWALHSEPHRDGPAATARTVRDLLQDTVARQLVSDVPLASLLSGGLDSSAVTALAVRTLERQGRGPLRTYALEFADSGRHFRATDYYADPDGPWVDRMVAALGTDHRTVVLDSDAQVEALQTAVAARDLPGLADIDASLYLFCRAVRAETTVALSGEAADEVFGGYPWCHWEEAITADTFPWSRATDVRVAVLSAEARQLLRPRAYIADRYRDALAEVPRLAGEAGRAARMREILYLNLSRFLPVLLERKDRMSMAVGLEVRVPFCDHRLVDYVWNIPWGFLRVLIRGRLRPPLVARRVG